ncbi:IS3 family transposase [Carboxylicivirga caseinilyticus]|uniref:IS3 family transposase n=1 Tax=Carboxylicivirga caseinilyticus TaxID=3417572 RepID=UPI003D349B38
MVSTCRLLGVSRQVYYRAKQSSSRRQQRAEEVIKLVQSVRVRMPRLGTRKLYKVLYEPLRELHVGRDTLFAIVNANHMSIKPIRSYRTTTNSHHRFRKHKNLVSEMTISRPEQVWVSDITYIGNRGNHHYLSLITDAYSKKIVGYNLSDNLNVEGALDALKKAIKKRKYEKEPLIHHSDRGIQYCSNQYQKRLNKSNILTSMTESYDPYANAIAERVNGIIKGEFELEKYAHNSKVLKALVAESIETYNKLRPHFSCGMLTPEQMHEQRKVKIKKYSKKLVPKGTLGD